MIFAQYKKQQIKRKTQEYWYNTENAPSHKYGDSPWGNIRVISK